MSRGGGSSGEAPRVAGSWYSMWQTPGTHASSTFHAAHLSDAGLPPVPLPSSQHRFVCPHNLPAKKATQVVPSQWGLTSPSILHLACSCPSTLAAFILSLFTPWRGDTKRHLPGRDKPILAMPRGEPDATRLSFPFISLPSPFFSGGETCCAGLQAPLAIQWRVYSCVCVCLFSFWVCVCLGASKDPLPPPIVLKSSTSMGDREGRWAASDTFRASVFGGLFMLPFNLHEDFKAVR